MNKKRLFRLFKQLTKSELIILLNYLEVMSASLNEYTQSILTLTRLLCRDYKTFLNVCKCTNNNTLKFILNGVIWVKKEIKTELLNRSKSNE